MSATLHKLPNIADGPQLEAIGNVPSPPLPTKTYALVRKVGGIWFVRLGKFRISFCKVKG